MHSRHCLACSGSTRARSFNDSDDQEKFTRETLHRLVLHEVGHTLGLEPQHGGIDHANARS